MKNLFLILSLLTLSTNAFSNESLDFKTELIFYLRFKHLKYQFEKREKVNCSFFADEAEQFIKIKKEFLKSVKDQTKLSDLCHNKGIPFCHDYEEFTNYYKLLKTLTPEKIVLSEFFPQSIVKINPSYQLSLSEKQIGDLKNTPPYKDHSRMDFGKKVGSPLSLSNSCLYASEYILQINSLQYFVYKGQAMINHIFDNEDEEQEGKSAIKISNLEECKKIGPEFLQLMIGEIKSFKKTCPELLNLNQEEAQKLVCSNKEWSYLCLYIAQAK